MIGSKHFSRKSIHLVTMTATMLMAGGAIVNPVWGQKKSPQASEVPVSVVVTPDGSGVMTLPDGTQKSFGPNDGIVVDEADLASGRASLTLRAGQPPVSLDQARRRGAEAMKETLASNDEEWAVLEPRIHTIQMIRMAIGDTRGTAGGGSLKLMSLVAGSDPAAATLSGNVSKILADFDAAQRDFRAALNNEQSTTEQLTKMLEALRASERTARAELTSQRAALRELVTRRQEAQLYQMGILN